MQVWDETDELRDLRHSQFKLSLDDALAAVFQRLARQALDANVVPNMWMHHGTQSEDIKSASAHRRVQLLQFQSQIKSLSKLPSIGSVPLVTTSDVYIHEPSILPDLPPCLQNLWIDGRLSDRPQPTWSKFYAVDFEKAQNLIHDSGAYGGIGGKQNQSDIKPMMRIELYVGSAVGKLSMP